MKKIILLSATVIGTCGAHAESPAFQASLTPDVAIYNTTTEIDGFAINVWGQNPQHSLNLGIVNGSSGTSSGFAWGLVNYDETYTGVAWGAINISYDSFTGWQDGLVNISQGTFTGLQSGWVNISAKFKGLQFGVVNYADTLNGVQIGLLNVDRDNPWFTQLPDKFATGFPILNWSF